ncbi:MAG: hypothetical protein HRT58_21650 [Crocinitomicaceae bacterium]|nr:hypothetical protein [Flavobacteriales bacterium]NQZ38280.1 hypothetical protein [Crocinitomicaceae bacterium]
MQLNILMLRIGFFSLLAMTSCSIETAEPLKSQALVIASDLLHAEDTVLFQNFTKNNGIRIIILHLSPDQIIATIKKKGYNSGIDMVLSQNMQTPIKLNKSGILHDMVEQVSKTKSPNQYISYKHNFIGIGLDPFVFKYTNDSVRGVKHYQDLNSHHHYHTLSKSDMLSFLSPIRKERNRAKTYEWTRKWNQQSIFRPENGPWNDSAKVVLCKYSQLETFQDSIWQKYPENHFFPNEDRAGVYYDLMTLSIVQQAEHFTEAQKFLAYCQNSGYNATLNAELNRFPIYDYLKARTEGPKFYPSHIDQLLQYHDVLERMLHKLN